MAYLYLSDGTLFEAVSFGYEGDVIGEVVGRAEDLRHINAVFMP